MANKAIQRTIDKAKKMLESNADQASELLVAVINDPEAPIKQRIEAARLTLEYSLGKPGQTLTVDATVAKKFEDL